MSFTEFFIKRHVLTWMIMVGLIFFGLFSYQRIGISEFPDVDFPTVSISISRIGSSPELNEIEIAYPVESAISGVEGIKRISSSSTSDSASITAEFDIDKNIDVAVQDIQATISRIQKMLPDDSDPAIIRKTNPEDSPIMFIGITSDKLSRYQLMGIVRDQLKPLFSTVDGVADIFLGGYREPNLRVWIDSKKLEKYDLSANDVLQSIQSEHQELPAGKIENEKEELNVRTYGEVRSIEDFLKLPILRRGGSPNYRLLHMSDVATVAMGLQDDRFVSRSNGKVSIGLGIKKQRGVNAVAVAYAVKEKLKRLQEEYKDTLNMKIAFDTTTYIEESVHELLFTLFFSAILTSIVCLIFLGSMAATINVVLAIPTAIIGSFLFIHGLHYTLNTFTLLGLSMAVGIVVDDAIMIHENISRHELMGKKPILASIEGGNEIVFAVIATTLSLLAIFTPVAYVTGVIGKYLAQFGLTLSAAVFLSMIEALTLTPMRYSQFKALSKRKTDANHVPLFEKIMHPLLGLYSKTLDSVLRKPVFVVLVAFVLFVLSLFLIKFVPKEFTPYQDVGRVMLSMRAPIGVSIQYMDEKFKEVEDLLMANKDIKEYFGFVGGDPVNTGRIFVTLQDKRKLGQREIANALRAELKKIQGVSVFVQDNSSRGFSTGRGFPVEFNIQGPDYEVLAKLSEEFKQKMTDSKMMTDVDTSYRAGLPEIQVIPDRQACALRGVSITDVNQVIRALIGGVVVGRYTEKSYRYDIRVRMVKEERAKQEDINRLYVRNNRGELIPLSELISLKDTKILQQIDREDLQRAIIMTANIAHGYSQEQALDYIKSLEPTLPQGYFIKLSGSAQAFQETFSSLMLAMFLGVMVTYMLLASQFNSFLQPLIILLAIPFSLSGAFLALLVFRQSLNIYSMIGILLILGLVLKNSIMLVDFTNKKKNDEKMNVEDAIKAASPLRLRPILMTSLATIVGAIPAALALGPGAESRIPMALTVIGGITISTLFTLVVVPCVYKMMIRK